MAKEAQMLPCYGAARRATRLREYAPLAARRRDAAPFRLLHAARRFRCFHAAIFEMRADAF